jgi:hypothetical protein
VTGSEVGRTTVKRASERGRYDMAAITSILAAGLIAHVGVIASDGTPVVIPMGYALDGESVLIHGSVASRLMRAKSQVCVTVTILDGLVVARSLFNSSMNYRSVVVLGVPEVLVGDAKLAALLRLSDALLPGRVGHARAPSEQEVRATTVWRLPLDEASAKVRTGPPIDEEEDLDLPYWAGVIPLRMLCGEPERDEACTDRAVPDDVRAVTANINLRGGFRREL